MIIFDLDDTLIDTSGAITPWKLKECIRFFSQKGVYFPDLEEAYLDLLKIDAKVGRSEEALRGFLEKKKASPALLKGALERMRSPLPEGFSVPTTPKAVEVLKDLKKNHTLAIVSVGDERFQMQKLEKAGIDKTFFSKIAVPEGPVKGFFYRGFMEEFSLSAKEVLVCGDRVCSDLEPAFSLGMRTVHMLWGRGKSLETPSWVGEKIFELSQLKGIIDR